MEKFLAFDVDNKKTVACVVPRGRKERFATLPSKVDAMRKFLQQEKEEDHLRLSNANGTTLDICLSL